MGVRCGTLFCMRPAHTARHATLAALPHTIAESYGLDPMSDEFRSAVNAGLDEYKKLRKTSVPQKGFHGGEENLITSTTRATMETIRNIHGVVDVMDKMV